MERKEVEGVQFGFSKEEIEKIKQLEIFAVNDNGESIKYYREDFLKKTMWKFCLKRLSDIVRLSKKENGTIDFESLQKGFKIASDLKNDMESRLKEIED